MPSRAVIQGLSPGSFAVPVEKCTPSSGRIPRSFHHPPADGNSTHLDPFSSLLLTPVPQPGSPEVTKAAPVPVLFFPAGGLLPFQRPYPPSAGDPHKACTAAVPVTGMGSRCRLLSPAGESSSTHPHATVGCGCRPRGSLQKPVGPTFPLLIRRGKAFPLILKAGAPEPKTRGAGEMPRPG